MTWGAAGLSLGVVANRSLAADAASSNQRQRKGFSLTEMLKQKQNMHLNTIQYMVGKLCREL
jgi:hypothetical protein